MSKCNKSNCSCGNHDLPENIDQLKNIHDQKRRDFIRYSGISLLGMGVTPSVANFLQEDGKMLDILKTLENIEGKAQRITILHTSDIHAQLDVHDEFFWENNQAVYRKRGGFAHLKTMLNALKIENPKNTLVVDGGDCFQGSAIASFTQGKAIVPIMNQLPYDLMLPGNWEVVYGKKILIEDMNAYKAQKICANMFHSDDLTHNLLFKPYKVFQLGTIKVGFVGYNDPLTPIRQSPDYSKGIKFTKPEVNIEQYVKELREIHKCQLVFVLSHMGLAQQLHLSNQPYTQGVDYILGADTHERIRQPLQGKYAKVTEPGAFASFVGKLDIVIENGKIKDENYELLEVDPEKYKADAKVEAMIEKAKKPYKKIFSEVLGKSTTPLLRYYVIETPMDNLITDALMWKIKTDIVVSNGFRFCPPLIPDATGYANITREYLWSMLPVSSELKTADVTGEQLLEWLENELENAFSKDATKRFGGWFIRFKGMKVTFTIGNEKGKRVQEVLIKGKPLVNDKVYSVAACERDGDPENVLCRIRNVHSPFNLGLMMHDIIEEYLGEFPIVSPKIEGRAVATDASQYLLSQVDGLNYQFR